jgi:hypothetical protein
VARSALRSARRISIVATDMSEPELQPTRDDGAAVSYHLIAAGTPVYAAGGERVGSVLRVLDHPREGLFDGIVIEIAGLDHFVDAPEVRRCAERAVTLTLTAAEAARLPRHAPGPPVRDFAELAQPDPDAEADAQSAARRRIALARNLARSRTLPMLLAYVIYLVVGWQLPTPIYLAGIGVCLALLAVWMRRRVQARGR